LKKKRGGKNMFLPSYIELTSKRKKLLELLSDGKWHRKFPSIGIQTFDFMQELGFIRIRHIDKNPWKTNNWTVEAHITLKGRFLLKKKCANMIYEYNPKTGNRVIRITEMEN